MDTSLFALGLVRDLTRPEEEILLSCLPPERRARLARVKNLSRRREILCVYGLLRLALRQTLGWHDLPDIALSGYGKPFFPACPGVCFNLSHTSGAVLVGLSDGPIGVDVEKPRPVSPRLTRRVAGTEDADLFFRRWVCLEACGKRDGTGIWAALRESAERGGADPASDGCYRAVETLTGYVAGVAVSPGRTIPDVTLCTQDALSALLSGIATERA